VFWPDAATLSRTAWWEQPAWVDGATYGQLVEAVRPALRAALLLGWNVHSIYVGLGAATGESAPWVSIRLATLELAAAPLVDLDMPFDGPNVLLAASEIVDRQGVLGTTGGYAIGIDIPILGDDDLPADVVPSGITQGVDAFVGDALAELVPTLPVRKNDLPARAHGQGLLWLLYSEHWSGLNAEAIRGTGLLVLDLRLTPEETLIGELYGRPVSGPPRDFWTQLWLSAQAEGRAHHLPQRLRDRLPAMSWLDTIGELLVRGVIEVPGLVRPIDPPPPIRVLEPPGDPDDPIRELTLSIWGGDSTITLRRVATFADERHDDLTRSVSWDYVPGDERQRPMVVIVAGRGVEIVPDPEVALVGRSTDVPVPAPPPEPAEPPESPVLSLTGPGTVMAARGGGTGGRRRRAGRRPGLAWDLLVHRVMDDALVPSPGTKFNPLLLLDPSVIDPDPNLSGPQTQPALLVVPKHDGVFIQFPGRGTRTPATAASGHDIPRVIELTIPDPTSGRSAWTADVHFFPYPHGSFTVAGAHLSVWTTPDVLVNTNDSPSSNPTRGDPSFVTEAAQWISAWQYSAELWEADDPTLLPRPFSAVLPIRESSALRPDLLVPAPPPIEYEDGRAVHDGLTLTPALHAYRQYAYVDSLAFDLMDLVLSFVPVLGDLADIGEALYAMQTGRDKWGRPVSEFEVALMVAGAAVPIVSGSVARELGELLTGTLDEVPAAELGRLATPMLPSYAWAPDRVEAVRGVRELTAPEGALVSRGHKRKAEQLVTDLAADDGAARAIAARLADGRAAGWPTLGDTLSQDGDGFMIPGFQTAWLRYRRDNPDDPLGLSSPLDYARWLKTFAP
jgi:hypothetical protein